MNKFYAGVAGASAHTIALILLDLSRMTGYGAFILFLLFLSAFWAGWDLRELNGE